MNGSMLFVWVLALTAGAALLLRPGGDVRAALRIARSNALMMAPRIPLALLGAGFLATLIPEERIAPWIGPESGWQGVLLAAAAGGFVPSGPMVSFPLAIALVKAGAGMPQTVAFLTAWSLLAFHRVLTWEIPFLGPGFAALRLSATWYLPLLTGLMAGLWTLAVH